MCIRDRINISVDFNPNGVVETEIVNHLGAVVQRNKININASDTDEIDVSQLTSGLYFITFYADGKSWSNKIVIQK